MPEKISPGMQQYLDIKKDYPDAFLLFRMGDFYEFFYDDAINAAQILELTLTSRNKNSDNPIPMAGVPFHAVDEYIEKLIARGNKVAIADQIEDSKQAVGIVKRAVTQVVTPGTAVDERNGSDNNFLVAFDRITGEQFGFSYIDLATGEFKVTSLMDFTSVIGEITSLKAREVVVGYEPTTTELQILEKQMNLLVSSELTEADDDFPSLTKFEAQTARKLLAYIHRTQLRDLSHLHIPEHYELTNFLQMDYSTKASLELTINKREGKKYGTLYWLLDSTKTAMGTRLLRTWIERPLINITEINQRTTIVQLLIDHFFERTDLIETLKGVYDLERLASRVSFGKALPVDLLQLANSLSNVPAIKNALRTIDSPVLSTLIDGLDEIPNLHQLIEDAIDPSAMRTITEGNIIKTGYNAQLDKYHEALKHGTSWITELESKERARTNISGLRIDYNRQDGYYFHVTQSQLAAVPDNFYRKKSLKNSERYGSTELSEMEEIMLEAREGASELEYNLFLKIRDEVATFIPRIQALAKVVATIDCLQSLAIVSEKHQYVCPQLTQNSRNIKIIKGRHAVIEAVIGAGNFVSNDILLPENTNIQLITGPNMSGKSTYMRQLALLVVMAQIGSFVPAEFAELPIFDAIFTRIGASDDLISGESTFMMEMSEANYAIQHATINSLILFDELGRGTATYDGMALAQAIIEYIHKHIQAKTLFATHYHELTALDKSLPTLKNVHVTTFEHDDEVTFLHKIADGSADKSYGIHVAKIAGLPQKLLTRADTILQKLENNTSEFSVDADKEQLSLFKVNPVNQEIISCLETLNPMNITPLEALNILDKLKKLL